jgi:hypothetical protein
MSRIYDYGAFTFSKKESPRGEYSFGVDIKYIDIDIHNRPKEYQEIEDAKAFIEYSVNLEIKKNGIAGLDFSLNGVELEFTVDDYPNPTKSFDIDLIPGRTIDIGQVHAESKDYKIPTYPSKLEINMNGSTDPKKFDVTVHFGSDSYNY